MIEEIAGLEEVKLKLQISEPLLSYLFYRLELVADNDDNIIANTDGKKLHIGIERWRRMTLNERFGVIIHELLHTAFEHPWITSKVAYPMLFNAVADVIINKSINGKYALPNGVLRCFSDIHKKLAFLDKEDITQHSSLWFYERSLELLKDDIENAGEKQKSEDKHKGCIVPNTSEEQKDEVQGAIYGAIMSGLAAGKLAGDVVKAFEKLCRTKTDWKSILRKWITIMTEEIYSFAKPKQYRNVILPSFHRGEAGKLDIILIIDSSGSIDDEELHKFACEIYTLVKTVANRVFLIVNDADIQLEKEIKTAEDIPTRYPGRGGTVFGKAFERLKEKKLTLEDPVVIILTDGEISDLDELHNPGCPTIWGIVDNKEFKPPFGGIIRIDTDL